jgi:sulfate/thiosulfate transport system ATP-binding protein
MDIRLQNIRKAFDGYAALSDASIDIRSGELIALLGPSGSGKTTLLRLIAGLEFPDSGSIHFGDEDASWKSVQERNVGFVFQHYALFRHMSVADNIGFGLRVRPRGLRPPKREIRRRALELLELVQLSGLEARFPAQLSGGQRQRVALARALAIEPAVLLLDEPFGALDAKVRRELRRWLRDLHDRTGHTTIFVTHDQEEAMELADRVAVMSQGRIEQVGTPDEIYDRPASPFVFSFIGESTALPIRVADGRVRFREQEIDIATPELRDGPGELYLRPQDLEIVAGGPNAISGTVALVRRHNGARRAELALGDGAERLEVNLPPDVNYPAGTRLNVMPKRGRVFQQNPV